MPVNGLRNQSDRNGRAWLWQAVAAGSGGKAADPAAAVSAMAIGRMQLLWPPVSHLQAQRLNRALGHWAFTSDRFDSADSRRLLRLSDTNRGPGAAKIEMGALPCHVLALGRGYGPLPALIACSQTLSGASASANAQGRAGRLVANPKVYSPRPVGSFVAPD